MMLAMRRGGGSGYVRIVMVTADWPPIEGGISTVAYQTGHALAELGHELTVVAPYSPQMQECGAAQPFRVIRFRGYRIGWLRLFPMLAFSWRHVRRAELVLAMNIANGGVIAWLSRLFGGAQYVTFAYAYEFLRFRRVPFVRMILRSVYRRSATVIAISQFAADALAAFRVPPEHICVAHPGAPRPLPVSDDAINSINDRFVLGDGPVVLAVGRFIARKGHETVVRAWPRVLAVHPNAVLVLTGRGPRLPYASRTALELGVRDSMRLTGYLSDADVAALYRRCSVFALPTGAVGEGDVEGYGLVFTEANAYGKPVVAGRSGGTVEAVVDGETGLLVEPDDPEAVTDAILKLLDNPDVAAAMGEAGRRRAEAQTWRAFAEAVLTRFSVSQTTFH